MATTPPGDSLARTRRRSAASPDSGSADGTGHPTPRTTEAPSLVRYVSEGTIGAPVARRATVAGTSSGAPSFNPSPAGADERDSPASSSSRSPSTDDGVDGDDDRRREDYHRRYDQLRLQREVERMQGVAGQLKERERLLKRFYTDPTLPVSDDVGITLGQIRALALELGNPSMDALVDKLETAIEDQMLTLLTHLRGGNDALVEGTAFQQQAARREARRAERKAAIERSVSEPAVDAADAEAMLRLAQAAAMRQSGGYARSRTNMSPPRTGAGGAAGVKGMDSGVLAVASGASSALFAPSPLGAQAAPGSGTQASALKRRASSKPSSFQRPPNSGAGSGVLPTVSNHSLAGASASVTDMLLLPGAGVPLGGCSPEDLIGATSYLVAESVAKAVRCERVRLYFATDDGLGVRHATSFPSEPPAPMPPQLPRSLLTSVFHRGLAVAGFQQTREPINAASLKDLKGASARVMQQMAAKQKAAAAQMQAGLPRCTLVFPIAVWTEGKKRVAGVIECLDKEPGEDELGGVSEAMGNVGSQPSTSSQNGKRFTARDELLVFTATQLLGALMERYPAPYFATDLGPTLQPLNTAGAATGHLPAVLTGDVPAAAQVGNRSLRAAPTVDIFRGPMTSVHRFAVGKEDAKKEALGAGGGGGQAGGGGGAGGGSDIRNVEESLDSLNAMWRKAYEENVQMHRQCRNMAERMNEMRRVTERFEDVLATARELTAAEDIHDFLRVAELSLKAGKAAEVDRAVDGGLATAERARELVAASSEQQPQRGESQQPAEQELEGDVPSAIDAGANSEGSCLGDHLHPSRPPTAPAPPRQPVAKPRRVPTAAKRDIPIAEVHYDGPPGVRPYTVDPVTKRDQVKAIDAMIAREEDAKHEAERRRLAAIPGYARGTAVSGRRAEPTAFDLPPDPAEIEGRIRARRVLANETMGGVPLRKSKAVEGDSTPLTSRPATGGSVGGRRSVTLTPRTPFRLQQPGAATKPHAQ